MPPGQFESLIAYMTRSVRDISQSSRQQSAQYDRMGGAMQAVIEIAEQVAGNSQQTSESAERLELIVRQLQQLVGVRRFSRQTTTTGRDEPAMAGVGANGMNGMNGMNGGMNGGMGGMDGGMMPPQGMRSVRPMQPMQPMQPGGAPMAPNGDWRGGVNVGAGAGNGMGGGYGEYDGYGNGGNGGYGNGGYGNEGPMMPMNGGASQEWRMPPMPQMPQMQGPQQLPPGPPMGRMQFGDDAPPSRGPRSRGMSRGSIRDGGSQFNSWRRDGYGPDDDGTR
jgi:hypothetical protein